MKRLFVLLTACLLAVAAYAQTAEEIIAKMDEAMSQVSEENGFRMTMDMKIPILGTMSTNAWTLGDKMRLEAKMMGKQLITWEDGETEWTYDADENTITIENQDKTKKSDEKENMKMFQSATEGYDVSIAKGDRRRQGNVLSDEPERQGGYGHRHLAQPPVQRFREGRDFQQGRLPRRHHHRQEKVICATVS